ncbi:hypothetical protein NLI96_g4453 [Meripilus lineatus]|uniref:Uncharacterized protein n=1 Tax=Meripilus lineatus TaxID=2056292 RepID=A0AAD5YK31_9APHY|nr:hypothetical protein NLI96_g4453 [Physisporinus lineatus]
MANLPRSKCRLPRASKPTKEPIQIDWGTKGVKAVQVSILEKPRVAVSDAKWVRSVGPKAHIPRSEEQVIPKPAGLPTRKVTGRSDEPIMRRSFAEDDSFVKVNVEDYYPVTPSARKVNVVTEKVQQFPPAHVPVPTVPPPTPTLPSIKSPRPLCILCILRVAPGAPCKHQGQPRGLPAETAAGAQVAEGTKAPTQSPVVCCDVAIGTTSRDSSDEIPPASAVLHKIPASTAQTPLKSSIGVGTDIPIVAPPKLMVDASVQAVGAPVQTQYEIGDDDMDSEMTEEERKKAIFLFFFF